MQIFIQRKFARIHFAFSAAINFDLVFSEWMIVMIHTTMLPFTVNPSIIFSQFIWFAWLMDGRHSMHNKYRQSLFIVWLSKWGLIFSRILRVSINLTNLINALWTLNMFGYYSQVNIFKKQYLENPSRTLVSVYGILMGIFGCKTWNPNQRIQPPLRLMLTDRNLQFSLHKQHNETNFISTMMNHMIYVSSSPIWVDCCGNCLYNITVNDSFILLLFKLHT